MKTADETSVSTTAASGTSGSTTEAAWIRTISSGNANSAFLSVASDTAGNLYAAGYQSGTASYSYGAGVSATGVATLTNAVLVKYDSAGVAQWARTILTGASASTFNGVKTDSLGNVYVVGFQDGNGSFAYGAGVSVSGVFNGYNAVIVKYDAAGSAQWARSVTAGGSASEFKAIAIDAADSIYVVGSQYDNIYSYGPGVSVTGAAAGSYNPVLIKYDAAGNAAWARSTTTGSGDSTYEAVTVDPSGNVIVAGWRDGTSTFTYGPGVSLSAAIATYYTVLVKYNASGQAQWAKSSSGGGDESVFRSVAADSTGNIYAAGVQRGAGTFTYDTGITGVGLNSQNNAVIVKYNSSGTGLWARVASGGNESEFSGVGVDSNSAVYVAGNQRGTSAFTYGPSVTISSVGFTNSVLVKYDTMGSAQWAKTVVSGSNSSAFVAVLVRSPSTIVAAGSQTGTGSFSYGTNLSASGTTTSANPVLVKYIP